MSYEVNQPLLNSPFDEPSRYWFIREGYQPELKQGRRPAIVYPPREGDIQWNIGEVLKASPAIDPFKIAPEVQVKGTLPNNQALLNLKE